MEGLYIAVNLETDSNRANVVWEKIGEQKPALSNLVNMLEDCNDNQFDSLVNELKTLVNIFDRVELNYEKSTTKSPEVLNVKISEDLFRQIQKKTSDIRDGIIN